MTYTETESGAFTDLFGGKEGVENILHVFFLDPVSIVANDNADPALDNGWEGFYF